MQNFNMPLNQLNKLSRPLQDIGDLNMKTLQKLSYIHPQELSQMRDPKVILEKNVQMFVTNSRISLDYVNQLFTILENSLTNVSRDVKEKTHDLMQESHTMTEAMRKAAARSMPLTRPMRSAPKTKTRTTANPTTRNPAVKASSAKKTSSTMATNAKKASPNKTAASKATTSQQRTATSSNRGSVRHSSAVKSAAASSLGTKSSAGTLGSKSKIKVAPLSTRKVAKKA